MSRPQIAIADKLIADIKFKGVPLAIWRNEHGHFFVIVAGKQTQSKLGAEAIVRYLCNAMQDIPREYNP